MSSQTTIPAVLAGCLLLAGAGAPAPGQEPPLPAEAAPTPRFELGDEFPLGEAVRTRLGELQRDWHRWRDALEAGEAEQLAEVTDQLLAVAGHLGMERLPDLAGAAAAASAAAAEEGRGELARAGLDAAERLDPGRASTRFARSAAALAEDDLLAAAGAAVEGYLAILRGPQRRLWGVDVLLWALTVAVAGAAGYVLLLVAAEGRRGAGLYARAVERVLPRPIGIPLLVLLLGWPLAFPDGPLWLLLWWSVLLWLPASAGQRVGLVLAWAALGVAPVLVEGVGRDAALARAPAARVIEDLERRRLPGTFFHDLAVLETTLPGEPAVLQVLADVHRRLEQWPEAGALYARVADLEPGNVDAVVDLGVYHFQIGNLEEAARRFAEARSIDPQAAAPPFNLAQVYSSSYRFDAAERALQEARRLDPERVGRWLSRARELSLVTPDGGLERLPEVRRALEEEWQRHGLMWGWPEIWARALSVPLVVALLAAAAGLQLAWIRFVRTPLRRPHGEPFTSRPLALVPGLAEARQGRGVLALLAVTAPLALLALPLLPEVGSARPDLPPRAQALLTGLAVAGLVVYFGVRARWPPGGAR